MAAKTLDLGAGGKMKLENQLSFLPEKLLGRLMQFQKEGVSFAIKRDGKCLIGDEMGLGKTLQALSTAYYYRDEWPLLIVVPSSLRYPWIDEVEKWFPDIDPAHINLISSGSDTGDIASSLITVVTYGLLRCPSSIVLQEALMNQQFKVIIVDESHYMKNRSSATSKYLVPLVQRAERRLLLTGTPALARPEELFPQVDALYPRMFGTWTNFAKRYCNAHLQFFGRQRKWVTDGASNLEELQRMLSSNCMIRRLKKDVLTQLPPKQRQRVLFPIKESVLKKDLDLAWREMEVAMGRGSVSLGAMLEREMPQEASTFEVHRLISSIYRKTAAVKLGPVKEYVKMLCDNQGLKFIVFAHHHVMLDAISELLHDEQVHFIRIDGHTDQQARPHLVHEFQADKKVRVAVLSIKAAGVGLTLTEAKLVVFAELDWTPGVLGQCEDRAHRIGQRDTVHVHYLVAKGTLDEWVWSALARKTAVVTTTLNGKRQVMRMGEANQGQIKCLANAEAWIPKPKSETDEETLSSFFATQQLAVNKQRSIQDFFTPKGQKRKLNDEGTEESGSLKKKRPSSSQEETVSNIILVDSSDDEFATPKSSTSASRRCTDGRSTDAEKRHLEMSPSTTPGEQAQHKQSKTKLSECQTKKWSCEACTFLNHSALPMCEMCNTPKKTSKGVGSKKGARSSLPDQQNRLQTDKTEISTEINDTQPVKERNQNFMGDRKNSLGANRSTLAQNNGQVDSHIGVSDSTVPDELMLDDFDDETSGGDHERVTPVTSVESRRHLDKDAGTDSGLAWVCARCECENVPTDDVCDVCLADRPPQPHSDNAAVIEETKPPEGHGGVERGGVEGTSAGEEERDGSTSEAETREVNLDQVPVYERFQFCCSRNTSRLYLFDERGETLNVNFVPLDVEMEVFSALPDLLLHPHNMRLVKRFLREWDSFAPTKRRVIVKAGQVFSNPLMHYEELKKGRISTKQRFVSKADVAVAAVGQAGLVNGSVRTLTRPGTANQGKSKPVTPQQAKSKSETPQQAKSKPGTLLQGKTKSGAAQQERIRSGASPLSATGSGSASVRLPSYSPSSSQTNSSKANSSKMNRSPSSSQTNSSPCSSKTKRSPSSSKTKSSHRGRASQDGVREGDEVTEVLQERLQLPDNAEDIEKMPGMIQAVTADGTPLCVNCQKPYDNKLVSKDTVRQNPWATRFCSQDCAEQLWTRRHGDFAKQLVFEVEFGKCQVCQFDAQKFFERIKVTRDVVKRASLIQDSKYSVLSSNVKQQMARDPKRGQFWQADHIQAVYEGGGQCDVDNLRTLCTPCHRDVTAQQTQRRHAERRHQRAAKCRDITAFFKRS